MITKALLDSKPEQLSRMSMLLRHTRMFCSTCQNLQEVKDLFPLSKLITLACGHKRSAA